MRMAIIKNGVVTNIAVWDGVSEWEPDGDAVVDVSDLRVGIGYTYDGETFTAPPSQESDQSEEN